jgi:RNA polymerase sigma-70 factor (ECF subfamily)
MTDAPERAPGGSTSRSLLNEARLADAAAWERLVTLYAPLVASWCRRWGVLQQDIVDVLQEVFSAVAAHLNRFRKDRPGDTFRGWLMAIARNKTLDHFQRKSREPAAIGGTEASMRLQEIRDPEASADSVDSDVPLPGVNSTDDLVFNDVLLRALESIRPEFQ